MYFTKPHQVPWLLQNSLRRILASVGVLWLIITLLFSFPAAYLGWISGDAIVQQLPPHAEFSYDKQTQKLSAVQAQLPLTIRLPLNTTITLAESTVTLQKTGEEQLSAPIKELLPETESFSAKTDELQQTWNLNLAISFALSIFLLSIGLAFAHSIHLLFFSSILLFMLPWIGFRFKYSQTFKFSLLVLLPAECCWIGASLIHGKPELWMFDVAYWTFAAYFLMVFRRQVRIGQSASR